MNEIIINVTKRLNLFKFKIGRKLNAFFNFFFAKNIIKSFSNLKSVEN